MVLGIIGEAGVGKSTATNFFESQGAYIISADIVVKYLYLQSETKEMIIKKLGDKFRKTDDTLDRLALRKYAFENYEFLKKLEEVIWPKMSEIIINDVKEHQSEQLIVIDCAVLFNAKLDYLVDKVLLIKSDEELQIKRIQARDDVSEAEAKTLLDLQKKHLVLDQKVDFTVQNNGSTKEFMIELNKIMAQLVK